LRTLQELSAWWDPALLHTFEYMQLDLPSAVSGRPVTPVGAHLVPFGYHGGWATNEKFPYWADLFERTGISFAELINVGDSAVKPIDGLSPIERLLQAGVIPMVRESMQFGPGYQGVDTLKQMVPIYAKYGLRPMIKAGNEPLDPREWPNQKRPPKEEALAIIGKNLREAAKQIVNNGGLFGLPDGPSWSINPFAWFAGAQERWIFDEGLGFYVAHNYAKGRHKDYPYDSATREGTPLTPQEYREALGPYWMHKDWMEIWVQLRDGNGNLVYDENGWPVTDEELTLALSLGRINTLRRQLADPVNWTNAVADDVCHRGHERTIAYSIDVFGYVVPMMLGEGGWCPKDRPGSGAGIDYRMPYTSPDMVAKRTVEVLSQPHPYFAYCPWILADGAMCTAGSVGWEWDAWVSSWHMPPYEYEKPIIAALEELKNAQGDLEKLQALVASSRVDLASGVARLDAATKELGG